jgi:hypothetical protein
MPAAFRKLKVAWARLLDTAATAAAAPDLPVGKAVPLVLSRSTWSRTRLRILVRLIASVVPGGASRLSQAIYQWHGSAFAGADVRLLGFGAAWNVFLVTRGNRTAILKIRRHSIGQSAASVEAFLRDWAERERRLRECLSESGVLLRTQLLVVNAPVLRLPAAAILQEYAGSERSDLLADFTDEQLRRLLHESPGVREQLARFCRGARRLAREHGWSIDLAGTGNLAVVQAPHEPRVVLTDTGLCAVDDDRTAGVYRATQAALERLESLLAQAEPVVT